MTRNKKKGTTAPRFKGPRFPRKGGIPRDPSGEYGGNSSPATFRRFVRPHGYTLADEARNTAYNRQGALGRDSRLRHKPVSFISAGFMDPLKELEVQLTSAHEARADTETTREPLSDPVACITNSNSPGDHISPSNPLNQGPLCSQTWTSGPPQLEAADDELACKSDSESVQSCDSREEVIVFKGRGGIHREPVSAKITGDSADENSLELHELDLELQAVAETLHHKTPTPDHTIETDDYISLASPKRHNRPRKFARTAESDEEAAVVADYIANIENRKDDESDKTEHLGLGSHSFSILRDLGGTDSDAVPDRVSSEDDTDRVSEDGIDTDNQQRRLEAEDGRIARILAKQEELGLGSDNILLFDGEASGDEWLVAPKAPRRRKRKGDSKKAKIIQKKGQYPSATQMADAFDELDFTDRHRAGLNNFKNGPPPFNVSDSELEEVLKSTWQKDRMKKAEKKKAREELRSRGLLGKNVNPDDLRVKYMGGMSLDDLASELEIFLLGSQEQLILPPFDKDTRRTIHSVANRLKIKSQSAGKGKDRYPVLYRSKATLPFDQAIFDRVFGRIKQTWFPRVDVDDKLVNQSRILKQTEARNGKSRVKSSVTYSDGDIVGQHAAEISAENKGRAMLEKMGWSKGMALGSEENKGIMVPITHVVRKTKAGLGDA
ncbi:squalene synthetase-like protein [Parahypoxylon ruwenzoriense]